MKKWLILTLALMLALSLNTAAAEENREEALARANALAAVKVSLPQAVVDYAVRERDDGKIQWMLFFTQGDQIGMCKVLEETNEIRKVTLFAKGNALTAQEAMAKLIAEKGEMTIVELELDWDDGALCYEGEAEMGGRRYEFEMTAAGRIIEWERD